MGCLRILRGWAGIAAAAAMLAATARAQQPVAVTPAAAAAAAPLPSLNSNFKTLLANFTADEVAVTQFRHREHVLVDRGEGPVGVTYLVRYVRGHEVDETVGLDARRLSDAELAAEHQRALTRAADDATRPPAPQGVIVFAGRSYPFARLASDYVYGTPHATEWKGRETWVYPATPNRAVSARSREEKVLFHSEGEIWVDAQDLHVVRITAHTVRPVNYAFGLLATIQSATLDLQLYRQAPGLWLPLRSDFTLQGTLLMFKDVERSKHQQFDDFSPETATDH